MRQYITADSIATTVRMLRSVFAGSFLIVEGDADARLWKRLVDQSACRIQLAFGRENVLRVVAILDGGHFVGHLGLIDRDFAVMLGESIASENIVLTDENDIEVMLFKSDVFERFIFEYANVEKITAFEGQKQAKLRDILVASASTVGTLRYLSKQHKWNLDFDGMRIRYKTQNDIEIDVDAQIEHLRGRSHGTPMPVTDEVKRQMVMARTQFPALLHHVCGHDLCEVISKGVHRIFGRSHIALGRGGAAVEEVFRASYTILNLQISSAYEQIKGWEASHAPYRILHQQ